MYLRGGKVRCVLVVQATASAQTKIYFNFDRRNRYLPQCLHQNCDLNCISSIEVCYLFLMSFNIMNVVVELAWSSGSSSVSDAVNTRSRQINQRPRATARARATKPASCEKQKLTRGKLIFV